MQTADIIIIGAGPAGLSCALQLAKLGISSTLLEKEHFPRDKVCGDALSGKAIHVLRQLDEKWPDELESCGEALDSWGVTFVAPNRKQLRIPFYQGRKSNSSAPGLICKRIDFDAWLARKAMSSDLIDFRQGAIVTAQHYTDGQWQLEVNGNKYLKAKLLIVATGAQSKINCEISGFENKPSDLCAGIRTYFSGVQGLDKENFIELHFLKNFLPGYLWIFPLPGDEVNIGLGMRSDILKNKKLNLRKELLSMIQKDPLLRERFKDARQMADIRGFSLPLGSKKRTISGDGFLLIGDTASLIDPFTGEGIGNAMMSGVIAAETATDALNVNNFSASYLNNYDNCVYQKLWDELKLSRKLQHLSAHASLFNFVVNRIRKSKKLRHLITLMFEDIQMRKQLSKPFFYFKLLFRSP